MPFRNLVTSIAMLSLLAACSDNVASPVPPQGPTRFAQWATPGQLQFDAVGAVSEAMVAEVGFVPPTPQVVVDQSSSASADAATLSWSHTVGADSNRLLVVSVAIKDAAYRVTSLSYGGAALTYYAARNNSDNAVRVEMWYLASAPTGSDSVRVGLSGGTKVVAGAISFSGVDPIAPLRGLFSSGSTASGTAAATTVDSSGVGEVVFGAVATDGDPGTLTPVLGQTGHWNRVQGTYVAGGGSTAPGATGLVMGWTTTRAVKWAMAAAVVRPYVTPVPTGDIYQATFWAVRGSARTLQISARSTSDGAVRPFVPLLLFTTSDPLTVPGRGTLAAGDSVLVTVSVDPVELLVTFEPAGLTFGTPARLQIWYRDADSDLNGDGAVDLRDSLIESQRLGLWYQGAPSDPWERMTAAHSLVERSFNAALQHFSRYAVAW